MRYREKQVLEGLLHYVHEHLGFRFTALNRDKLETKLGAMRLPARWENLEAFSRSLREGDQEAHDLLVKTITVNHTYFFRERDQIEAMVASVKARHLKNPQIWSAASSTGEEAYSIAIHLLEQGIDGFHLVASDINPRVLHHMNRGVYHEERLEKVPRYLRLKYFTRDEPGFWKVVPELRRRVAIKRINLVDPVEFRAPFDFIFCRNVFIYFDDGSRNQVIRTLSRNLHEGGYLYLGLTEALLDVPPGFVMESHSTYRRLADVRKK